MQNILVFNNSFSFLILKKKIITIIIYYCHDHLLIEAEQLLRISVSVCIYSRFFIYSFNNNLVTSDAVILCALWLLTSDSVCMHGGLFTTDSVIQYTWWLVSSDSVIQCTWWLVTSDSMIQCAWWLVTSD